MFKFNVSILALFIVGGTLAAVNPVPVLLWHGMGDDCCHAGSMGYIKRLIEAAIPGVYVRSLMIGNNEIEDSENGFFMNVNKQIEQVCEKIRNDSKLANGYHSIGFSQGGQFLRGLAERCPQPPMRNLISVGGQHQGIYGLPHCSAAHWICQDVRRLIDYGVYTSFVQNTLVQAEYWHDPLAEQEYKQKSIFLADINNELHQNDTYKRNLLKLSNFVLIKFTADTIVVPPETEWFGFYAENNVKTILPMNETSLYTQDRIGLRELHDSGRLHFLTVDADHLRITKQFFETEIINKFLK